MRLVEDGRRRRVVVISCDQDQAGEAGRWVVARDGGMRRRRLRERQGSFVVVGGICEAKWSEREGRTEQSE